MSRFPGTSRSLGPVKQCSVYVRGGLRCAWCTVPLLLRREATVDHLDGDHRNNEAWNLVPACWTCNGQRKWDWEPGLPWEHVSDWDWWHFDVYLAKRGVSIEEAVQRVDLQRWMPLPRSTGELLARRWHPERMAYEDQRTRIKIARRSERLAELREERAAIRGGFAPLEVSFP